MQEGVSGSASLSSELLHWLHGKRPVSWLMAIRGLSRTQGESGLIPLDCTFAQGFHRVLPHGRGLV